MWAPGSQGIVHGSVMFMHLVWKRGVTNIHFCVAVRWASQHTTSQREFSARSGMCVPVQGWWDQAFLLQEFLLSPAHFHAEVPFPSCPGWRLWGPSDSSSGFVESCSLGYSWLPVCGNQFNAAPLTQSSSHLGLTNFMQLAALKIWMHSLKDSTEEKQPIMGEYAFWDR